MITLRSALTLALILANGVAGAADMPAMAHHATGATQILKTGAYRIELHLLPPEEFYSPTDAKTHHATVGMLVVGGATPVATDASPRPNHHLVVHVFDRKSGAAVTEASVAMTYRALDAAGHPQGHVTPVPTVTMQALGAGQASTHFGNNLLIPAGSYAVTVTVNGATARFRLKVDP